MASAVCQAEEHTPEPLGRVERRRARVRQQLIEAAETLMGARGVDAVTVEEITEAADVARRTFYHHFDSKHDLLVPIARAWLSTKLDAVRELFEAEITGPIIRAGREAIAEAETLAADIEKDLARCQIQTATT